MANEEQLNRLKKGVEAWNKWRGTHPNAKIDLTGADLSWADLRHANLSKADLYKANLFDADLGFADLSHANLAKASLLYAKFDNANLGGADLSEAEIKHASFSNVDLSTVKRLQTDKPVAPNPRGHRNVFALIIMVLSLFFYLKFLTSIAFIGWSDPNSMGNEICYNVVFLCVIVGSIAIFWVESKVLHYVLGSEDFARTLNLGEWIIRS